MFWCGVKSKRIGFFHVSHFSIYFVNALVFNGKAVVERRGFRPKIFDEAYFTAVTDYVTDLEQILLMGSQEARQWGLGAMDALHVAAAVMAGAKEFMTTEKPSRSIYWQ